MPPKPIKLLPDAETTPTGTPKPVMFEIKDKGQLYSYYMPFIKTGGIFIPNGQHMSPGSKILILLNLPDDKTKKTVSGRVAWTTPQNAHMGVVQGIGIAFDDNEANKSLKIQIENALAGILGKTDQRSQTI